ncbi:MAG: hypothetical protein ACI9KE_003037 [Polyangiales bacterium]|jgi:hypothetical protein
MDFLRKRYSFQLWVLLLLVACGDDSTLQILDGGPPVDGAEDVDASPMDIGAAPDPSDALFRADHVLEISITMDPADWASLRAEPERIGLPKITCDEQPAERIYTYFSADITIDGETTTNVGLRKKGGFGSLSETRPGFKVKPGEFVADQRIASLSRLTLNNNVQDPTLISQCLGYGLFRAAGVPASRCSFAHVVVNGEDLGIYSNVESLKKNFLRRHFADDEGRLYESGGEFLPGRTGGFQPKTNKDAPDCTDLDAVAAAVAAPDAEFPAALGAVVDIDAFTTYWAMEVLMDHWDGFTNNQNNYFFYHDPTSDRLHFIPWGIDMLFMGRARSTRPTSVFACGSLPWRLYDLPESRAAYVERLRSLLDTIWNEEAILADIARMQALLEPYADPTGAGALAEAIQGARDFVSGRRDVLTAELDAGPPEWPYAQEESCRVVVGEVSATFETTWGTFGNFTAGSGTMDGTVSGISLMFNLAAAMAGLAEDGKPIIQLFAELDDGRFGVVFLILQDGAPFEPSTLAFDLVNVTSVMTFFDPVTETSSGGGLILGGSLTLTEASQADGAAVSGTLTGTVLEL